MHENAACEARQRRRADEDQHSHHLHVLTEEPRHGLQRQDALVPGDDAGVRHGAGQRRHRSAA